MAARRPTRHEQHLAQLARQEAIEFWIKVARDVALVVVALGLTVHEGLTKGSERPSLYVLYAGMMGLGPVLRLAENRSKEKPT